MDFQATDTRATDEFDELESLLQGQQQEMRDGEGTASDGLCDLDDLLAESMQAVAEDRGIARHRAMLARKNISSAEREELEAKVREWEARRLWETLAHVAVFYRQACACGQVHIHFSHMMLHQKHRTDPFAQRWVKETVFADTQTRREIANLPNKVAFQNTHVPMCHVCAETAGFDLNGEALNWEIIQLAQEV